MKVLFINTADIKGGAALLADSIAELLTKKHDLEISFLVSEKFSDKDNVIQTQSKPIWFLEKCFSKFADLFGFNIILSLFLPQKFLNMLQLSSLI